MGLAVSKHEEFWEACGFGHSDKVRRHLESKVIDVNWKNHSHANSTALHLACQGKIEIIKLLLDAGCNVNTKDDSGNLPLHFAAMNGHADIIELLLAAGSEVNACNANGWTAVINAAYWCQDECLRVLIKHNADISINNKDGRSALYEACRSPCKESGESLVFEADDLSTDDNNVINFDARSDTASTRSSSRKVRFSEVIGAAGDAYSQNSAGDKDYEKELASIVRRLVDAGADVNGAGCVDQDDFTPLIYASYHGHNMVVSTLLDFSCNKSPIALQWARNKGNVEVQKTLEQYGITYDEKTVKELVMPPPLLKSQMPRKMSSSEFVRSLLDNGNTTHKRLTNHQYRPQRRIPQALGVAPLPPSTPPPSTHKRPLTTNDIPCIDD